jgi:lipopolysaccharide export system protein LptC
MMTDLAMVLSASWAVAPSDNGTRRRVFAAVRRHSRQVRFLRIFLPLAGLAAVAGFVVVTHFAMPAGADLAAASMSVTRNSIIMDQPHLTGYDRHHREYSLAATRAIQPLLNPQQVRLEEIKAKVINASGSTTTINAEAGDYDHAKNRLKLLGAIAVDSAEGYLLRMNDAEVDFSAGTMVSDNPVSVAYGDSSISGKNLSISDGGKTILIVGDVRTWLMPPKRQPATAAATPPGNAVTSAAVPAAVPAAAIAVPPAAIAK